MKIFVSWSGDRSKVAAEALVDWLPNVIQAVRPWISTNIDKGKQWGAELVEQLANTDFGILCLTAENLKSPWLLFEAGALSKYVGNSNVCPLLFGLKTSDVDYPLAQFQLTCASIRNDMYKLVQTINGALCDRGLSADRLERGFGAWWPELESKFQGMPEVPSNVPKPGRSDREILEELLALTRYRAQRTMAPSGERQSVSEVMRLVEEEGRCHNIKWSTIEPVYSRMPPPPDEPHMMRLRTESGRSYVVRTPLDLSLRQIRGLVSGDLERELGIHP